MLCCFSLLSFIFHFRSLLHILKLILNSDSVLQLACNHSHINAFCQCNKHRTSEAGEIGSENLYHNGIQLLLQILSLPISVLFFLAAFSNKNKRPHRGVQLSVTKFQTRMMQKQNSSKGLISKSKNVASWSLRGALPRGNRDQ